MQGHNEDECRRLHPKLIPVIEEQGDGGVGQDGGKKKATEQGRRKKNNVDNQIKILTSGKVVYNVGEQ